MAVVDADEQDRTVAGFGRVADRVRVAAAVIAVLVFVGAVADGVVGGLSFAGLARWAGVFLAAVLAATAVAVALDAYGRADAAQRRGDRLTGDDVRVLPPRPRRPR